MAIYDYEGNEVAGGSAGGAYANNLDGKIWLCIGDSLTSANDSYRPIICSNYNLTAPRVSSTPFAGGKHIGYATGASSAFEDSKSYQSTFPNIDIATILMGTNDYNGEGSTLCSPMGTIYDDPAQQTQGSFTFYGCYKGLIENIFTAYGVIPIVLITPPHRSLFSGTYEEGQNAEGCTLADYREAILKLGEWYSLPVVDLFAMSGYAIGRNPVSTGYSGDGLHPGPQFWQLCAPRIYYAMNEAIKRNVVS